MRIMRDHKYEPEHPNAMCRCVCGDEMIVVEKLDKIDPLDEQEYAIDFKTSYMGNQRSKLKAIWHILRGKERSYCEVIIPEGDYRKFLVGCATLMHK